MLFSSLSLNISAWTNRKFWTGTSWWLFKNCISVCWSIRVSTCKIWKSLQLKDSTVGQQTDKNLIFKILNSLFSLCHNFIFLLDGNYFVPWCCWHMFLFYFIKYLYCLFVCLLILNINLFFKVKSYIIGTNLFSLTCDLRDLTAHPWA